MCDCKYCERGREFKIMLNKIEAEEVKEYMKNIYGTLCDFEENLSICESYLGNLKNKYPIIYKEIRVIKEMK